MPFKPGHKPANMFTSTNQPDRSKVGRKPALYKQLTAMMGSKVKIELSREDFNKLQQWMLERNKTELEQVAKNPNTPIFLVNMAMAIVDDIKGGSFGTIERTLERIFGKPKITAEIEGGTSSTTNHTIDLSNLNDEELEVVGKLIAAGSQQQEKAE